MAFKHGSHGQLPGAQRGAAWKCPTCDAENLGPLEAGCTACKAGADAKRAAAVKYTPEAAAGEQDRALAAFLEWSSTQSITAGTSLRDHAEAAFRAGAAWQLRQQLDTAVREAADSLVPEGGARLLISTDDKMVSPVEDRAQSTIVAALLFYADNTLAYGAVPGQLSAEEARTLAQQLSPKEVLA